MRLLLDTQVFFMAATGASFPKRVQALLASLDNELLLSSISILEIALKNARKKIDMPEAFMHQAVQDLGLTVIAFEPRHAYRLFTLPMHHADPFDRMIIATALVEDVPVIGGDGQFARYEGLRVIW
ncbi:MAG: type II toxin-antitoxin system VapC family toxin [Bryobacteraceae bacterium]